MSLIKANSLILFTYASFSRTKQLTVLTELFIPPVTCASSTHLWVFSPGADLLCSTGINNYSVSGLCRIIKLVWLGVHWKTVVLCVIMKARSTFIHFYGISAVDLKCMKGSDFSQPAFHHQWHRKCNYNSDDTGMGEGMYWSFICVLTGTWWC